MINRISLKTHSTSEFVDITTQVDQIVKNSRVESGVCYVYVPHTTAGITINEHDDPGVVRDILERLEALVPQKINYRHLEGNSPGHIKASLMGNSVTVLIEDNRLMLGTWQGIFFAEFDGPRDRTVLVKIGADKLG